MKEIPEFTAVAPSIALITDAAKIEDLRSMYRPNIKIDRPTKKPFGGEYDINNMQKISKITHDLLNKLAKDSLREKNIPETAKNVKSFLNCSLIGNHGVYIQEIPDILHFDRMKLSGYKTRVIPEIDALIEKIEKGEYKNIQENFFMIPVLNPDDVVMDSIDHLVLQSAPRDSAIEAQFSNIHIAEVTNKAKTLSNMTLNSMLKRQGSELLIPIDPVYATKTPYCFRFLSLGTHHRVCSTI
jgi:hypothetical protein